MHKELLKYDWKNFKNADLKRQFKFSSVLGAIALPDDKFNEVSIQHEVVVVLNYHRRTLFLYNSPQHSERLSKQS